MHRRLSEVSFAIALGALLPLFAFAATTCAMAAEATIGDVPINLPAPAGFCELSERNPPDNYVLTNTGAVVGKAGNKLLAMSAHCQQLDDWRAHRQPFLDDYGQYQTPLGQMDQLVAAPEETIAQSCASLRAQGEKIASDQLPDMKAAFESTLQKIRLNETKFIGVFAEDKTACYAGLISKIQAESGTEKTQIVVFAVTVVRGKVVLIYRFAVYTGSDSVTTTLLTHLKGTVAAVYTANR